jgi:hypothetical protein
MSEHATQEHTGRRTRKETAQDTTALQGANGEDHAANVPTVEVEMTGLKVELPLKFAAGHILTDHEARVLDAAYQRQFRNNQEANATNRAKRFEKATTDAERPENAPLTAAQLVALYTDYQPAVGDTVRMSTLERMRHEAAWRAWVALVTEHNATVGTDNPPVILKAVMADGKARTVKLDTIPTTKPKSEDEEAFKARKQEAIDRRQSFCARMLDMPDYADRIQAQLDAIMAERGAKETKVEQDVIVSGDALL